MIYDTINLDNGYFIVFPIISPGFILCNEITGFRKEFDINDCVQTPRGCFVISAFDRYHVELQTPNNKVKQASLTEFTEMIDEIITRNLSSSDYIEGTCKYSI